MAPQKMKAVWVEKQKFELTERDVPKPGAHELLIKNVYVASNPKDWKIPQWMGEDYATIEGNDIAGYVEELGEGVTNFEKGDKVASFTKMRSGVQYGAYAEYSVGIEGCTFKLGEQTKLEDAVTLPLAVMTAALAIYSNLELAEKGSPSTTVLVNGGSSSVGSFAIQMLKRSGYRVVATAGASAHLARDLGADEIVDYRGKSADELSKALANVAQGSKHVLDAATDANSAIMLAKALTQGGRIAIVLPNMPEKDKIPNGVEVVQTRVAEAYESKTDFAAKWYKRFGEWLEDGSFKGNKPEILPKGLASVPEGIEMLKAGKVSGAKLVYRISDTP